MHLAYDAAIPPLGILPQRNENIHLHKTYAHTCMWIFLEVLFITAEKWNNSTDVHQLINA